MTPWAIHNEDEAWAIHQGGPPTRPTQNTAFHYSPVKIYYEIVAIKLCPRCKRPFLAQKDFCPNCPEPYSWNQESFASLGCLLATILPLVLMILFWLFLFLGVFLR